MTTPDASAREPTRPDPDLTPERIAEEARKMVHVHNLPKDHVLNAAADTISDQQAELTRLKGENERLREGIRDACDLLAERTYGSPARSPGHNARLLLDRALLSGGSDA